MDSGTVLSRIRLRHLSCFVAIAQQRTLAGAAGKLHLSQPAVSKTLAELEALAGRRLVERGRAGARLTPDGERFLRYAIGVTRALETAADELAGTRVPDVPAVRVAALPTVAGGPLAQAIATLRERRPHARIEVETDSNPELLAAVKSGAADFAVGRMAEPAMMQGVSFELLYAESLAVVTRPGHPLATGEGAGVPPLALLAYPLVIPGTGTAPRHDAESIFAVHGITVPPGSCETQSVPLGRALALTTDAVWITSQRAVQLDLDAGLLRRLDVPVPGGAEPVGLLSRTGAAPGELAAALMDALRAGSTDPGAGGEPGATIRSG
ncbi:MAG: LysR family transcriptional regulator [Nocardiopsaceae bacterium]|nr:LysR family transcriptional regulator [Nocardiopsaceae bacterium]